MRTATAQPGWPSGLTALLRHETRVYSIWVNGNENFYFQADTKQLNELIQLFSKLRLRDHQLAIKAGRAQRSPFRGAPIAYNVNLHVLSGIALAVHRQEGTASTFEPTLTLHLDPEEDAKLLRQISIPDNIILRNELKFVSRYGRQVQAATATAARSRCLPGQNPGGRL